jgi:hypothetical protein
MPGDEIEMRILQRTVLFRAVGRKVLVREEQQRCGESCTEREKVPVLVSVRFSVRFVYQEMPVLFSASSIGRGGLCHDQRLSHALDGRTKGRGGMACIEELLYWQQIAKGPC